MILKNHLTIQDYIRRAGLGGAADTGRAVDRASQGTGPKDFAGLLDRLQHPERPDAVNATGGLHITDYLKRPIRATTQASGPGGMASPGETVLPENAKAPAETQMPAVPAIRAAVARPNTSRRPDVNHPALQIARSVEKASAKYGLPAELIRSVIRAESNFQPKAVSPAGAQGLMQLMPATARELGVEDPFDIEQNIDGGARYLRQMLDMFDGDLKQALSAYNAGPGAVLRYNGNVPYLETRHYVQKVMAYSMQSAT